MKTGDPLPVRTVDDPSVAEEGTVDPVELADRRQLKVVLDQSGPRGVGNHGFLYQRGCAPARPLVPSCASWRFHEALDYKWP